MNDIKRLKQGDLIPALNLRMREVYDDEVYVADERYAIHYDDEVETFDDYDEALRRYEVDREYYHAIGRDVNIRLTTDDLIYRVIEDDDGLHLVDEEHMQEHIKPLP